MARDAGGDALQLGRAGTRPLRLADLANASPALMVLPLWQEVTWHAPVRPPSIEVVPAVAQALLSEPAGARPRRKRGG
jgi:hypothetical protein